MDGKAFIGILLAMVCMSYCGLAQAQAGPPLMTNDAGSPGPGHWEVNLAAIGEWSDGERSASAPDADINYGLGDNIQLSAHLPWMRVPLQGRTATGLGAIEYAVRWRFLDQDSAGLDLAIQPHVVVPGTPRAVRDGLSQSHREYVLPIQAVHHWARFTTGVEVARHWVEHDRGADQLGIFAAASCGEMECLAEINSTHEHGGLTQTFLGIGGRRALSDHVKLMGAIDHQVNGPASMRIDVVYLGIQVTY